MSQNSTKSRTNVKTKLRDQVISFPSARVPGFDLNQPVTRRWKGKQFTVSESHPRSKKGKYAEGGPFFTYLLQPEINTREVELKWKHAWGNAVYRGPIMVPSYPSESFGGFSIPSSDSKYLDPYGATAISIVDPTNPHAELGIALGEILLDRRVSVPGVQTWKNRTEKLVAAGSEFLSAQFGWLPLVEEIKNTYSAMQMADSLIENYQNASGTWVHREFEFPIEESTTEDVVQNNRALGSATWGDIPGADVPITRKSYTKIRRWFSGSFSYHGEAQNHLQSASGINSVADKLFGSAVTPELIWQLTPWTWAIDWFSNAGDVINNVNSFKLAGLVMKYGYIMEESITKYSYSMPSTGYNQLDGSVPDSNYVQIVKRRREANPFGFGVSWEGLSPTQLAITAALGITRLR